jgi:hypothetical protein
VKTLVQNFVHFDGEVNLTFPTQPEKGAQVSTMSPIFEEVEPPLDNSNLNKMLNELEKEHR